MLHFIFSLYFNEITKIVLNGENYNWMNIRHEYIFLVIIFFSKFKCLYKNSDQMKDIRGTRYKLLKRLGVNESNDVGAAVLEKCGNYDGDMGGAKIMKAWNFII